jgi:PAS domain S-box-containing protein
VKSLMRHFLSPRRFVVQLILIFLVIILIMTLGLGVPVMLFMNRQTQNQLEALIDQTNQTTLALFENQAAQQADLGMLLAERPTLNQLLLDKAQPDTISTYLNDFLPNTQVDAIVVCDSEGVLAHAGMDVSDAFCEETRVDPLVVIEEQAWWLTSADLADPEIKKTKVVVGQTMESLFVSLTAQTKMDYVLFYQGEVTASNILDLVTSQDGRMPPELKDYQRLILRQDDSRPQIYMASELPISEDADVQLIGLLDIESFTRINAQLRNLVLLILIIVCLLVILLAVWISRRISKPLNQLAQSASALREGNFTDRLSTSSKVWEVDQLANALDDARVSLKHSLSQLRIEKEWIESLLNSIVEGILTIDDRGRITYASEAIHRLTGLEPSTLLGHSVDRIFQPSQGEDTFSHQIPASNQSCRVAVKMVNRDVLLSVSSSSFVPPEAGNATRALVIRDVTDEERIHRLMGEFMANITHEFRTPLAALSASVELLLDDLPDLSTPEVEGLVQALNIGIINLQALIDNLIEAASIEGGRFKVNPKPVSLHEIIDDAVSTVRPIVQKHGLTLNGPQTKPLFEVSADKRRTSQALVNLLSNGIKHSPHGGVITVATAILGKEVLIEVCDDGEGVPKDRQSQLFSRFVTPNDDDEAEYGLGLGLSVVKAIIEAQHGEVGFKNREGGGAIFWFTLPIVKEGES